MKNTSIYQNVPVSYTHQIPDPCANASLMLLIPNTQFFKTSFTRRSKWDIEFYSAQNPTLRINLGDFVNELKSIN